MSEKEKSRMRMFILSAGVSAIVIAVIVLQVMAAPATDRRHWPVTFASDGEALYFTGRSLSGSRMVPIGGNHHMMMRGAIGCVDCHGADRKGGRRWPMLWKAVPSLEAVALAGDHGHDGHTHDTYTAKTLAVAITEGKRPDGTTLGTNMPRWKISDADLGVLTDFLLTP